MSWSYSGDPSSSDLDLVRFLIGDTDTNDQQVTDEEINYMLGIYGSPYAAAYNLCVNLMAKYARQVDYTIGPESVKASQRYKNYQSLAQALKDQSMSANAAPSFDDPTQRDGNKYPIFDVGMHDNGDQSPDNVPSEDDLNGS